MKKIKKWLWMTWGTQGRVLSHLNNRNQFNQRAERWEVRVASLLIPLFPFLTFMPFLAPLNTFPTTSTQLILLSPSEKPLLCNWLFITTYPIEITGNPSRSSWVTKLAGWSKCRKMYASLDLEKSYTSLFEQMWYSQLPCFDVINVTTQENQNHSESLQRVSCIFLYHITMTFQNCWRNVCGEENHLAVQQSSKCSQLIGGCVALSTKKKLRKCT